MKASPQDHVVLTVEAAASTPVVPGELRIPLQNGNGVLSYPPVEFDHAAFAKAVQSGIRRRIQHAYDAEQKAEAA